MPAEPPDPWLTLEGAMKVGLLGTGFGIAHAHIYHAHPQVSEVVVFGRTPAKLQPFADKFGYATTTDLSSIYDDPAVDLIDVCLPTRLHAEYALRALAVGKHVLCELPWPPPWTTPVASSTPLRPAAARCSWTCSAASTRPPSFCTPPSPRAATGR
jgi:D-arabinose 1-dehydrogenase-like Zn-dependent alcohol dehydrogenase